MYLSQWSWLGVGGAYLHRRGTIYTNTADGLVYMCVFVLIQLERTLPECILPDNLCHAFENNSPNIRRLYGLSTASHVGM